MVVGFITIYAISAYQNVLYESVVDLCVTIYLVITNSYVVVRI